eukprot:9591038-Alexandrium_andersonii.AAC.1
MTKDCVDCGLAGCGLAFANSRFRGFGPPSIVVLVCEFGICAKNGAKRSPLESSGDQVRGLSWARAVPGSNA